MSSKRAAIVIGACATLAIPTPSAMADTASCTGSVSATAPVPGQRSFDLTTACSTSAGPSVEAEISSEQDSSGVTVRDRETVATDEDGVGLGGGGHTAVGCPPPEHRGEVTNVVCPTADTPP